MLQCSNVTKQNTHTSQHNEARNKDNMYTTVNSNNNNLVSPVKYSLQALQLIFLLV